MAKLIVAFEIDHNEALKIEAQAKTRDPLFDERGIPQGYFNPDGSLSIDIGELYLDDFDDNFVVFEYRGVEYGD